MGDGVRNILITSPENIALKFNKIRDYKGYKIFTTVDTMKFLDRFTWCDAIKNWQGDIGQGARVLVYSFIQKDRQRLFDE